MAFSVIGILTESGQFDIFIVFLTELDIYNYPQFYCPKTGFLQSFAKVRKSI